MQTSAQHLDHRFRASDSSERSNGRGSAAELIRVRRKTALALIAFMTVLAVVLSVTLGGDVVPIILFPLPIAFPLLWWSASELSVNDVL